jgi:uncharacterized protein (TIGR03435 family)
MRKRRVKESTLLMFLWVCSVMLPIAAVAQEPQFEVASVKPDDPKAPRSVTNLDLDATDLFQYQGGEIVADGYLVNYLIFGYKIANAGEYNGLNAQLPKWAQFQNSQTFRLEARAGDHPTKDTLRGMVRSLLAERFDLKVHTETQQQVAWVLVKSTGGQHRASQLRPHTGAPVCVTVDAAVVPPSKIRDGQPPRLCGPLILREEDGLHLIITDYTMPQMAGELTLLGEGRGGMDELPGVNGTRLPGKFDLDLHFVNRKSPGASSEQSAASGPDFLQALNTQAGLEFKKKAVAVDVLIVDHVSQPTPD